VRKILKNRIVSVNSGKPLEVAALIDEVEKLSFPKAITDIASDFVLTVFGNTSDDEYKRAAMISSHLIGLAYVLNSSGRLITAPKKEKSKGGVNNG